MESSHLIQCRPPREAVVHLLESSGLPSQDVTDSVLDHFFYAGSTSSPQGVVGLELYGRSALLRSLVVVPERRQGGLASDLVRHAERYAHARGVTSIYLLTTTAEDFFKRRGYVAAARAAAPPEIRSTREFADLCPASSAFLVKALVS